MIKIGERRKVILHLPKKCGAGETIRAVGRIVYIHPKYRFATLFFDFSPYGTFCEAFHMSELGTKV